MSQAYGFTDYFTRFWDEYKEKQGVAGNSVLPLASGTVETLKPVSAETGAALGDAALDTFAGVIDGYNYVKTELPCVTCGGLTTGRCGDKDCDKAACKSHVYGENKLCSSCREVEELEIYLACHP